MSAEVTGNVQKNERYFIVLIVPYAILIYGQVKVRKTDTVTLVLLLFLVNGEPKKKEGNNKTMGKIHNT